MIIDAVPYFNEADVLDVRLHELDSVVDKFIILEAAETYGGGGKRDLHFDASRYPEFVDKIVYRTLDRLEPGCKDRTSGRAREKFMRDALLPIICELGGPSDVVLISDCDEIPRAEAVRRALPTLGKGVHRFKQRSFYYNVNTLVDDGHDFASRARVGRIAELEAIGSVYSFRMAPAIEVEHGGWHFGYFGGTERIKQKVAALAPFLEEYKLYGDDQLKRDIAERRDLHHRKCEMPDTFWTVNDDDLPAYLLANRERFAHFYA